LLYISKDNQATWEYVGSSTVQGTPGISTKGTCSVAYQGFDCSNIGNNNWFKFEIRDEEPANYYNITPINAPKLRESLVRISLIEGNNSFVNRSSGINQVVRLAINVFDIEKNNYISNANVSFWLTKDGSNYQLDLINQTDVNGNASYFFNPDCSYSTGLQLWKAGVTDSCYIDINTTDYQTTIIGDLINTLIQPLNGQSFLRGTNITIRANVSDDCNNLINVDNINFISKSNETLQEFSCSPILNEAIGYYNCTFNTSYPTLMPARYYNITINTSKQYYNPAKTTWQNAFFIETKPELYGIYAYPSGNGGWGETWYFQVNFTDEDLDSNTVYLYLNRSYGWISPSSQIVSGKNITLTFSYAGFSGSDIGERQYYFTAQDTRGYAVNSSLGTFVLDKDDVSITHIYGNDSVYNRSALPYLNFRVNVTDIDRNVGVGANRQGIFYYTKDGSNFVASDYVYTDASSNLTLSSIQVDCSFKVGPQKWIAGIKNDAYYKDTNSTTFYFTIITVNLTTNLTHPINKSFLRGIDDVLLVANVKDECSYVSGATVKFVLPRNNFECTATDLNNGTYTCLIPASTHSTWELGWYDVQVAVSKQYYNGTNQLFNNSFFLATRPQFTSNPVIITQQGTGAGGWGEIWTFQIYVKDDDSNKVNVSLYLNLTGNWQLVNSTIISASANPQLIEFTGHTFDCGKIGVKDVMFVATDEFNYSTNSTTTMTIEKDDTTISFVSPYSFTIRREGNDNATLQVVVYDADRNNILIVANVSYYVTSDGSNYLFAGRNQSDSSGNAIFVFNPDCNYRVGLQYWEAGTESNACYKDNIQSVPGAKITIIGQLKQSLNYPNYQQVIDVGDTVVFNLSIPTDCAEDGLQNETNVSIKIEGPSGIEYCQPYDLGNGYYNCSWNTSFHKGGYYNFTINASKVNFDYNLTYYPNWIYLNNTPPIYENASVTPSTSGWGDIYNFSIDIADKQYDNVTCKLYVYTNTWKLKGEATVYNGYGKCLINATFDCSDISSNTWFKFELNDGTNIFNTSNFTGPIITKEPTISEYVFGNNSIANRSGSQTDLLILRIKDSIKNSYVGSGVQGRILVTKDGVNYDLGTTNTTNSSGYLNVYFDPQADYQPGIQKWIGGIYQDSCYADSNSTTLYLTIYGDLINSIKVPDSYTEYLKPVDNITIIAHVADDNNVAVSDANVSIKLIHESGATYDCPVENIGAGDYKCNINTSLLKARYYNVSISSSKQYHNNGSLLVVNRIFVKTKPALFAEQAISEQGSNIGGWGETWTFKVNVTDEDLDNVTVKLYVRKLGATTWNLANVSSYDTNPDLRGPMNKMVILTYFSPGTFQTNQGDWEFNFTAEDTRFYSSSVANNFTIEKDDIELRLISGNGATVWRNGTDVANLIIEAFDLDQEARVANANITFYVTRDGNNFDDGRIVVSNSSGYSSYPFDPDCNYNVGLQKWQARIELDPYWKSNSTVNYTLTIKSYLALSIDKPNGEAYLIGTQVPFYVSTFDDCSYVSGAEVLIYTLYGTSYYSCLPQPANDLGNGTYYASFDSSGRPFGWWNAEARARKNYYSDYPNYNITTKTKAWFLASKPSLSGFSIDHTFGGWGENYKFSISLTDSDYNTNNVSLWKSYDNVTWHLVDSKLVTPTYSGYPVEFNERFSCEDYLTNATVFFKITTQDSVGFNDSSNILNITFEKDDVSVSLSDESNSTVRRIGSNKAYLKAIIYDVDKAYYPSDANLTIWITENGKDYTYSLNCTSSEGNCVVYYDPSCSSQVGIQYWFAQSGDSCYKQVNSTNKTLTVIGQLNVSIINPSSGSILERGIAKMLNASIYDECLVLQPNATARWYNSSWSLLASRSEYFLANSNELQAWERKNLCKRFSTIL
jgi:hypothetical protein